jgi:trehalose 6-phosphate synthase
MRLSLRFVVPLLLALAAFAYAVVPLVDRLTLRWFVRDLDIRASLIANTVQEPLLELLQAGNRTRMVRLRRRRSRPKSPAARSTGSRGRPGTC